MNKDPKVESKPDSAQSTPKPSGAVRLGAIVISGVQLLSVVLGLWIAVIASGQVLWTTVGFEFVALSAGVIGVLIGLGRFRDGFELGLLCIAGAVVVTGVFGLQYAAGPTLRSASQAGDAHSAAMPLLGMIVKARIGLGFLLVSLAAFAVLTKSKASWRALAIGLTLLLPVGVIAVWLIRFGGAGMLLGDTESAVGVARLIATLFGGLILFVIASIGGHYVIKAFDPSSGSAATDAAA